MWLMWSYEHALDLSILQDAYSMSKMNEMSPDSKDEKPFTCNSLVQILSDEVSNELLASDSCSLTYVKWFGGLISMYRGHCLRLNEKWHWPTSQKILVS